MYCPNCNIHYNDPNKRFCENCGGGLTASAAPPPPRGRPRTTPGWMNETIYVQMGGRPWGLRRTYLLVFVLLLLLLLLCCCLTYTDVVAAPIFIYDILGQYTPVGIACASGILLFAVFYVIIILLNLDINCIFVPAALLVVAILCVVASVLGWIELPDFADKVVDEVVDPVRVLPLPLPWDPKPKPGPSDPSDSYSPSGDCCNASDVTGVNQYRDGSTLYTEFDVHFENCLPVWGSQCLQGKAYVGQTQNGVGKREYWVDVTCCDDLSQQDILHCTTDGYEDQKKSWVWVEFEQGDCPFEVGFQSIYYTKPVPPDQPPNTTEDECSNGGSPCGDTPCCLSCYYDESYDEYSCDD